MMNNIFITEINDNLLEENTLHAVHERSTSGIKLDNNKQITLTKLQDVGKTGYIDLLLNIEQLIVKNERDFQANDPAAINTLNNATVELSTITSGLKEVRDVNAYNSRAKEQYELKKFKSQGVPNDQARKCLRSHRARLNNSLHYKLSPTEKSLIKTRMLNLNKVEKGYIALQKKALGIEQSQSKSQGLSL